MFSAPSRELVFLDTNVFVYAFLPSDPLKRQRALDLVGDALNTQQGCISMQVVHEFANVATKKAAAKLSSAQCAAFIDVAMAPMSMVPSSRVLVDEAFALRDEFRYSFYDSLMLAAALAAGAGTFYSEDLQDGQLVRGSLRIVNPFASAVHEPRVSYQFRYTDR